MRATKIAIAPNKHQTLAIGKQGSNVRLAVELTNIRIDVISVDEARERGLEVEFNVGLSPEQLAQIEAGERPTSRGPRRGAQPAFNQPTFNNNVMEQAIESFTESIEEHQTTETAENYDIDEEMFSEEQLRQMEADFEFDEELEEFDGESSEDDKQ